MIEDISKYKETWEDEGYPCFMYRIPIRYYRDVTVESVAKLEEIIFKEAKEIGVSEADILSYTAYQHEIQYIANSRYDKGRDRANEAANEG